MRDERKCWSMKDRDYKPVILHNETFKYTGGRVPPFSLHLLFFSFASIFNSLTPLPLILHRHIHYSALSLFIVLHLFLSMECFRVNTLHPPFFFFLSLSLTPFPSPFISSFLLTPRPKLLNHNQKLRVENMDAEDERPSFVDQRRLPVF